MLTPEVTLAGGRAGGFLACKQLNGTSSGVEFVTTALTPKNKSVSLRIIDVHGHISGSQGYPIDVASLLPPPEVVSIPDANLAAVVRETLGLSPGVALTSHTMLNLINLDARNHQITALTGLEHAHSLKWLNLVDNSISDVSALSGLTQLTDLFLWGNPLSDASINTHIPAMQARGIEIQFSKFTEYLWTIPSGISWVHVPLKVTAVDGVVKPIESIGDLYDGLGGADSVNYLTTYDPQTQGWFSYFGPSDKGTVADKGLTDATGIIAKIKAPVSLRLNGVPLGTNGRSAITLHPGRNLVGIPLRDSRIARVSDLFALEGISGNVSVIIVADNGTFKWVGRAGDDGDIPVTGGQSFALTAQAAATVAISGEGWYNTATKFSAPAITGIQVTDTTPVLALRGSIVVPEGERGRMPRLRSGETSGEWGRMPRLQPGLGSGFRVKVKNLSTGAVSRERRSAFPTVIGAEGVDYRFTVVDIETGRAAKIGDILEISAQSTHPFVGVEPLQYTVTVEDVKRSWIQLPALVAYEIPTETELLANYPNPFNPETWIPYRLAEDAFVTLTIYDGSGQVVRTLEVGHRIAAVYESRAKAIYWDGRNGVGERVASGVYFYHLSAGDYSATRRMVILK